MLSTILTIAGVLLILVLSCGVTAVLTTLYIHRRIVAPLERQLADERLARYELARVVNHNAARDEDVERLVQMLADRLPEKPRDRYARPLPVALPAAPDVRTQLAEPQPAWARGTITFDRLAAKHGLRVVARAAAPQDTRLTNFTGDMASVVREMDDAAAEGPQLVDEMAGVQ